MSKGKEAAISRGFIEKVMKGSFQRDELGLPVAKLTDIIIHFISERFLPPQCWKLHIKASGLERGAFITTLL